MLLKMIRNLQDTLWLYLEAELHFPLLLQLPNLRSETTGFLYDVTHCVGAEIKRIHAAREASLYNIILAKLIQLRASLDDYAITLDNADNVELIKILQAIDMSFGLNSSELLQLTLTFEKIYDTILHKNLQKMLLRWQTRVALSNAFWENDQAIFENLTTFKDVVSDDQSIQAAVIQADSGIFVNHVSLATKAQKIFTFGTRNINDWFWKYNAHPGMRGLPVITEVSYQELVRLFTNGQGPKMRVARNQHGQFGVISKRVYGFESYDDCGLYDIAHVADNNALRQVFEMLSDIVEIQLCGLVFDDFDMRAANLGRRVKIDGGWGFSNLFACEHQGEHRFDSADIKNFPFIQHYMPFNWWPTVSLGKRSAHNFINILMMDPHYQLRLNRIMLRILVLPSLFFRYFMEHIIRYPYYADLIDNEIQNRRNMLREAVANNVSFNTYLQTPTAANHVNEFMQEVQRFTTVGSRSVLNDIPDLVERSEKVFAKLKQAGQVSWLNVSLAPTLFASKPRIAPAATFKPTHTLKM